MYSIYSSIPSYTSASIAQAETIPTKKTTAIQTKVISSNIIHLVLTAHQNYLALSLCLYQIQ